MMITEEDKGPLDQRAVMMDGNTSPREISGVNSCMTMLANVSWRKPKRRRSRSKIRKSKIQRSQIPTQMTVSITQIRGDSIGINIIRRTLSLTKRNTSSINLIESMQD